MKTANKVKMANKEVAKKEKKERGRNDYIYAIIFVVFAIILEMANFVKLRMGVLPSYFGLEFAIILSIAGIILVLPTEWLKIVVTTIFLVIQGGFNIANASMFKMLYDLITVDMVFTLGLETADSFEFEFLDLTMIGVCIGILVLYILAVVVGSKFMPRIKLGKSKVSSICFALLVAVLVETTGMITWKVCDDYCLNDNASSFAFENKSYLYGSTDLKYANMKTFGFYGYYIKNLETFFKFDTSIDNERLNKLKEFVGDGKDFLYSGSSFDGNNVSGLLEGDNLIMVMMESIEWFAIDPINTPTLYNFIENDALKFDSYYSRNKTNISEQISLVGNTTNDYSFKKLSDEVGLSTPNSLPNLFKSEGYESVKFFHDYSGKIYSRYTINKELGFDEVFAMEDCSIENKSQNLGDFLDDGEFIESCKEEFMPSDKSFFSFFTSVSTHGPYNAKDNYRFEEYYSYFDSHYQEYCDYVKGNNLNYLTPQAGSDNYKLLRQFKSKAMALDKTMSVILERLNNTTDKNGNLLIDTTSIVMFADHNAYYSDLSYIVKDIDKYANSKDSYNVPLVIFSNKIGNGSCNTFCNTYDLFPTICDLYGLAFNKNLTQGYSIFSSEIENSIFLSSMTGAFDQNIYSVTMQKFYNKDGNKVEGGEELLHFKNNANNFLKKQAYIEDYYRINFNKNYASV